VTPNSEPDKDFPWWLLIAGAIGCWLVWEVIADDIYAKVLATLAKGLWITLFVTVVAFAMATGLGLLLAVMSLSRRVLLRQIARFYIEIVRGVPMMVLLLYVAFVLSPVLVVGWNAVLETFGFDPIRPRDFDLMWRAIIALTIGYSAFIAEVFRAGLQSIERGQVEAAEALGLGPWLRFRLIVFPQAFRRILPPLGNDFVAMVKDSSLVSVLGVADVTQLGKVTAAGNFRYFETYNVVALIYLILTITLSLGLRRLERHLRQKQG
jgi:polar amino acid transport system permease protein